MLLYFIVVLISFGLTAFLIFKKKSTVATRLSNYLPWAYFIDKGIVITKDARLICAYQIEPNDLAYSGNDEVNEALTHLNQSLGGLQGGFTCYIDTSRTYSAMPKFEAKSDCLNEVRVFEEERLAGIGSYFTNEAYLVFCYELPASKNSKDFLLNGGKGNGLTRELTAFKEKVEATTERLKNVFKQVTPLNNDELCTYLHNTVSARQHYVKQPTKEWPLDLYLSDSRLSADVITKIDDTYILTASLNDFPAYTSWQMISELFSLNLDFRMVSRFNFLEQTKAKKLLDDHRRALFAGVKGIREHIIEAVTKEESPMHNTDALALAQEAGDAVESLARGVNYGYLTANIIIKDKEIERGRERLKYIINYLNKMGFVAKEETLNNPFAFLGSLPGNTSFNVRKALVSTINFSHFFALSGKWQGSRVNHHLLEVTGANWPHLICQSDGGIFNLNLNVGDVGHTLIFGSTGSGKSILLGTLALAWQSYAKARVVFFDKDKSSRSVCLNLAGHFYDLGADTSKLRLNPFTLVATQEDRGWLAEFLVGHLQGKLERVTPEQEKAVREACESLATLPTPTLGFETFCSTVRDEQIRGIYGAFATNYGFIFCNGDDHLDSLSHFSVFEMNELMQRSKELAQFVLGYLFRRLGKLFTGEPTLLVLDEAWLFLDSPYFAATIRDWLKTLRKKNVYVVMATQELQDAANSAIFATISASCETKILLPNRQAMQDGVYELYRQLGLTDDDLSAIVNGQKKRDYYYASPKGRQIFQLALTKNNLKFLKEVVQ